MGGAVVGATAACIAVGCLSEDDGPTDLTLAPLSEVERAEKPAYDGMLLTPTHRVVISSVVGQRLLELPVLEGLTRIKIWVNHPTEPDKVMIGVG